MIEIREHVIVSSDNRKSVEEVLMSDLRCEMSSHASTLQCYLPLVISESQHLNTLSLCPASDRMVVLTCLSYPIPLDILEIELFAGRSDLDLTGSKTGYNAGDPKEMKIDVCLTALLMIPLLFIPNLIQKESDHEKKEVKI